MLAAFVLFLAVAVGLQWRNGAYGRDFAEEGDEAAHYVTGLLVRDYAAALGTAPPMEYARRYYDHYPKVALGHWPPFFYMVQAAWTLPFSASRTSILLFLAALAAASATLLWLALREELGTWAAGVMGVVFLAMPAVQDSTRMVMAELLLTLLFLIATLAYARFLRDGSWRPASLFALALLLTLYTKANGFALFLLPPLAILLSRRWQLLRRPAFWLPPAVAAALAAPWYLTTLPTARDGWKGSTSAKFLVGKVAAANLGSLMELGGSVFLALALIGLLAVVARRGHDAPGDPRRAAFGALLLATFLFHSFVAPTRGTRHMSLAAPALVALAAASLFARDRHLGRPVPRWTTANVAAAALALVAFLFQTARPLPDAAQGAQEVARFVRDTPALGDATLLVSSTGYGEGAVIAEVAMHEDRPGHQVLRASKLLSRSSWNGSRYQALATNAEEVQALLDRASVEVVVLDDDPLTKLKRPQPHHDLLRAAVADSPGRWQRVLPVPGRHLSYSVYARPNLAGASATATQRVAAGR